MGCRDLARRSGVPPFPSTSQELDEEWTLMFLIRFYASVASVKAIQTPGSTSGSAGTAFMKNDR
jgi:hypothetical protein